MGLDVAPAALLLEDVDVLAGAELADDGIAGAGPGARDGADVAPPRWRESAVAHPLRLVRAAGDDHDAAVGFQAGHQSLQEREVAEVVRGERRLIAVGAGVVAVGVLDAGVGDDGVERREPGGVDGRGERADRGEVGEIERQGDAAHLLCGPGPARCVTGREHDRQMRLGGEQEGGLASKSGGRPGDDDRALLYAGIVHNANVSAENVEITNE